jgi:thiamine-phosphate pyrophosphorylase
LLTRAAHAAAGDRSGERSSERSATRILVNDRVDVALAENADGVHLGESSMPVAEVARFVKRTASPAEFLLGVSCHSIEGARSAAADGAVYIFFGPIFATPSKAQFGRPQGLERLAEVCRAVSIPVVAIGGITLDNVDACLTAGAAGIAAIRLFQNSRDPAALVHSLHELRR